MLNVLRTQNFRKFYLKAGFSLIELMVVVSLFGIASSLVTASYLNFERNQRVKNSSSRLKNDLRFVQNKANSGDKGPGGIECDASSTSLGGWFFIVEIDKGTYTFGGDCILSNSSELGFGLQTVEMHPDTKINKISYGSVSSVSYPVAILYRPLGKGVTFHDARQAYGTNPDFFSDSTGALKNLISPSPSGPVTIEVSNLDQTNTKVINIQLSGEVSGDI